MAVLLLVMSSMMKINLMVVDSFGCVAYVLGFMVTSSFFVFPIDLFFKL